jgi:membrane protein
MATPSTKQDHEVHGAKRNGGPESPGELERPSKMAVLKRSFKGYKKDNLSDWAAALTYYGVLSIFPMIAALVGLLGFIGTSATQPLLDNLGAVAPGAAKDIFTKAITNVQSHQGAAGLAAIVGLVLALWSASNYVAAFMRASNAIYEVPEGRPIWKTAPIRLGVTLVLLVLLVISAVMVVFTGGLAEQLGNLIGLGSSFVTVWDIAKWPVLILIVSFMFAFLYWAAPNAKQPGFRWVSPGGIVGVLIWLVASALFAFYVATFGSQGYAKTYGAFAGIIIFLVWLWISNLALLFGAEVNAELDRGRRIEQGHDPEKEPFAELRDDRKVKPDTDPNA